MYTQRFLELRKAYLQARNEEIPEDQFAALVYTVPCALVAHADGKIDLKEKLFLRFIPEVLTAAGELPEEEQWHDVVMTDDYFKEIKYIMNSLPDWEDKFLAALKSQLHSSLNERNAIFQAMWRIADASADISANERKRIDEVSSKLGL